MGASKSSLPSSCNSAIAVDVNGFDTLPMRNFVSGVTGTRFSRSAKPNPSAHTTSPSTTTATDRPATFDDSISDCSITRACPAAAVYLLSGENSSWGSDVCAHTGVVMSDAATAARKVCLRKATAVLMHDPRERLEMGHENTMRSGLCLYRRRWQRL